MFGRYGRQNNGPPRDVQILSPGTCEYAPWDGQRGSAGVTKVRILKWESFLDYYPGGPNVIKGPYKGDTGEAEFRIGRRNPAGFEEGGKGHELTNAGCF